MQKHWKRLAVFLGVLILGLALMGCGKSAEVSKPVEPPKPVERWKSLGEADNVHWLLDTQSIVKMQTEKAVASTTDTIKRDVKSVWVKIEPIPGKEKEFAEKCGKETAYGLLYYRVDKLNREAMVIQSNAYKSDGVLLEEYTYPSPTFKPFIAGTMMEKIANEL